MSYSVQLESLKANDTVLDGSPISPATHVYCPACRLEIADAEALLKHGHEKHFVCRTCDKIFTTSDRYTKHNESKHHYCRPCDKVFLSQNNLEQHRLSSTHAPRLITCLENTCGKKVSSLSGLISHVEGGYCSLRITQKDVDAFITQYDDQNVIMKPKRDTAESNGTSNPSKSKSATVDYCRNSHNKHHLLEKAYHCPMHNCDIQFIARSALCEHIERGSCEVNKPRVLEKVLDCLERGMQAVALRTPFRSPVPPRPDPKRKPFHRSRTNYRRSREPQSKYGDSN
ncbi:uncharacterized protein FOMMEDRAFT_160070 [Fomitiporia mediterranea MF3/22]|uniref:uncharacterized protein n=1 Tax=Fomitiporia mediterranea (strain MF3/22) TaxID=694068 RepID=UPI000440856D|nr:uncharacterized protein FOMMEDRAFT_160070 [Fomitiporia mediterranea MF3/22]EJC99645.1 hypothetical protein FOMMEDRAFT_160070 [Fomitiporia mediterranea MF3/22]